MDLNLVDVIVLILAAVAAVRGWRRGFLSQGFELGGGFLGLILGLALGPRIAGLFTQRPGLEGALISVVVVLVLLSIGQTAGYLAGHRFGAAADRANLRGVDSGVGAAFGPVVTLVSFWLIGSLLVNGPSPPLARAFRQSRVLRMANDVLPDPPNVLAYIGQYLDTTGFPQVFSGLPAPLGRPVKLPGNRLARQAVLAADQSTVRLLVPACGGTQLGSGWIAAEGVVITNAHVVAGGDAVTVEDSAGRHDGSVVLFDPGTDIAVVRAEGLAGDPLALETTPLDRGSLGATLGFPGELSGGMSTHRAAVQARLSAQGKDIYGRRDVERDIYELRALVRQGDSGGPFVEPDGDVAGLIFAASTADQSVGYALTGPEIADEVRAGAQSTEPVGTGPCTH